MSITEKLESGVWKNYRSGIISKFDTGQNNIDYGNHLIREFNKKITLLKQDTGFYIEPKDAGFRYYGDIPTLTGQQLL